MDSRRVRMGFNLRAYREIIKGTGKDDGFKDTKATLRGEHKAASTAVIDQPRRHQIQFSDKTNEILRKLDIDDGERARIITAIFLLEFAVIAASPNFKENIFQALDPKSKTREGSIIFNASTYAESLLINIGYTEENKLEAEDIYSLIATARNFIGANVYVAGNSANGYKYEKDEEPGHEFSSIEQLNVSDLLLRCSIVMHDADKRIIKRNDEKLAKDLHDEKLAQERQEKLERERAALKNKGKASSSSWGFSSFLSGSAAKKKLSVREREVDESSDDEVQGEKEEEKGKKKPSTYLGSFHSTSKKSPTKNKDGEKEEGKSATLS